MVNMVAMLRRAKLKKASRLDTDAGLAPMSPLCVVSGKISHVSPTDLYVCSPLCLMLIRFSYETGSPKVRNSVSVPDRVTSSKTDPLWDGTVLLLRLGELLLRAERLVGLFRRRDVSKSPRSSSILNL